MRNRVLVLMAAMLSLVHGYVTVFHVEPVKGEKRDTSPISSLKRVKPIDPALLVPAA